MRVAEPTFELRYDAALIRRAVRCFARWKLMGPEPRLLLAGAVLLACAGVLAADGSWGVATVLVLIAFGWVLLGLVGWAAHLLYKLRTLRAMGEPVAWLTVAPDLLRFRSGAGETELPLDGIMAWRERPDFWVLLTRPHSFLILPTASMPPAMLDDLRVRLEEIGRDR